MGANRTPGLSRFKFYIQEHLMQHVKLQGLGTALHLLYVFKKLHGVILVKGKYYSQEKEGVWCCPFADNPACSDWNIPW